MTTAATARGPAAPLVKICGLTRADDAERTVAAGADFLGLNFWPGSKRCVTVSRAAEIAEAARSAGTPQLVGVFVDLDAGAIAAILAEVRLDIVQLHGAETPADVVALAAALGLPLWKAVGVGGAIDVTNLGAWRVDAVLLDTATPGRGGSGLTFDWGLAHAARVRHPDRRFVLAGGLTPANVSDAVAAAAPWAVDVASGVESAPGVKDPDAVLAFIAAARG